ncbi:hypothetical protein BD309DRAFT_909893 [Dichomitus squalens]|uniref:Uncharacterized protein n=1 Tax=Dichomitus squalens TaxID=114155 RepID=A0A4Q9P984_9APHY|nr:hypothetical protein BD309DRAFT_909893 [Dichomitus squalens]TBU64022.1 hypothetical protein BD310DRAFT_915201 [Dichomitus squalens]
MFTATMLLRVAVAAFVASLAFVTAMPSFEGYTSWDSIGNLVPGMSYLEGLGPATTQGAANHVPFYLSIAATRGNPGNVTMYRNRSPPLFYIHQSQLWHYHNESTILPVNVHNSTGTGQLPLQMIAGTKPDGVPGGRWRWQGTMLFYENGAQDNQGLFYACADVNGLNGMFLFLQCSPPPPGCTPFTVHSFSSNRMT